MMNSARAAKGKFDSSPAFDIVREYVRKFPDHPARSLARRILTENPGLYKSLNAARCAVQVAFKGRNAVKAEMPRPARKAGEGVLPKKYSMPDAIEIKWEPFDLQSKRIAVISDLQIPFHDPKAVRAAMKWHRRPNPDCILINGDLIDFPQISRFEKNPLFRDLPGDISKTREMLGWLRQEFKKARIVLKLGNHEERWEKHLWQSPLNGIDDFELDKVLRCGDFGVEVVGDKRPVMAGRLPILHGHEFQQGMAVSVNPARTTFLRTMHLALIGHNHQTSEHTQADMWHKTITCWSTGCLCGLYPDFARINKWNHGAAQIQVDGMEFEVENKRIQDGRVL